MPELPGPSAVHRDVHIPGGNVDRSYPVMHKCDATTVLSHHINFGAMYISINVACTGFEAYNAGALSYTVDCQVNIPGSEIDRAIRFRSEVHGNATSGPERGVGFHVRFCHNINIYAV